MCCNGESLKKRMPWVKMKSLFQSWGWGVRLVLGIGEESFKGRYDRSIGSRFLTLEGEGTDRGGFSSSGVSMWKFGAKESCRLVAGSRAGGTSLGGRDANRGSLVSCEEAEHPPAVLLSPKGVGRASKPSSHYHPWAFLQGNCGLPYSPLFSKPGSLQLPLISWAI